MTYRLKEIDVLRGIAIIMMIAFHTLVNLNFFADYGLNLSSGPGWILGRSTAVLFLSLVGISLTLSYSKQKNKTHKEIYKKYIVRGLKIIAMGFAITLITYVFYPTHFVRFGVLHLIGVSVILSIPFLNSKNIALFVGIIVLLLGQIIKQTFAKTSWLLLLGIRPEQFTTFDYFPLFPWFGLVLIGIWLGHTLYPKGKSLIHLPNLKIPLVSNFLAYLGKKALLIYLIHQPILIFLIYLIHYINY